MRILLLASHAVAEYDDVRMFADMGYDIFCPGGYQNPREAGGEGIRPAIPNAPVFPDLIEACERVRREGGDPGIAIDWAKARLPDEVIDWADVIIAHHYLDRWVYPQWNRIGHKRVIWRTCGQSSPDLEFLMGQLRQRGLQIVRYSPKESAMQYYAGQDALIRFGKYPDDYGPWDGSEAVVFNVAQHQPEPHSRDWWLSFDFWRQATEGLPAVFAGPHSELIGGIGALTYTEMLEWLRKARVYLYTGTVAAPYTLGLIEAMLSGIPVVSIGPKAWNGPEQLFEAWEIAPAYGVDASGAHALLRLFIKDEQRAREHGATGRTTAISLFGMDAIKAQWREFLA